MELKTSSDSYDSKQFDSYSTYANPKEGIKPIKKLWKHYRKIIKKYNIFETYEKMKGNTKNDISLNGTKKYVYQLHYLKCAEDKFPDDLEGVESNYSRIYLVYLTLMELKKEKIPVLTNHVAKPNVSQIVLSQIIKKDEDFTKVFEANEEKENKWKAVREILEELIDNNGKLRD